MTLPRLLTVDELAEALWPTWTEKRRRRWVYRQVEERGMPAIKLGRQLVLDTEAVSRWLDAQRRGDNHQPEETEWSPETTTAAPKTAAAQSPAPMPV